MLGSWLIDSTGAPDAVVKNFHKINEATRAAPSTMLVRVFHFKAFMLLIIEVAQLFILCVRSAVKVFQLDIRDFNRLEYFIGFKSLSFFTKARNKLFAYNKALTKCLHYCTY